MKLLACGFNGCVYDLGDSILKKFNGSKSEIAAEIEFCNWHKGRYNLIRLTSAKIVPGAAEIPRPLVWDTWDDKQKARWIKRNSANFHAEFIYPKLDYTLASVYWRLTKTEWRNIAIQLLKSLIKIEQAGYRFEDIHSQNIMHKSGNWYFIDYGSVRQKPPRLWGQMALALMCNIWPDYFVYPNEHKPQYKPFAQIKTEFRSHPDYASLRKSVDHYPPKIAIEVALEIFWITNPKDASILTGHATWLATQPVAIKTRFGKPNSAALDKEIIIYWLRHLDRPHLVLQKLKKL